MAGAARSLGLDSEFDLLLTYDYENLNTPIQDTARRLKEDLAKVELKAGQGRKITVLAHSMGGLVSRWFIEKEGGHELVEHLVMCGTPNRGSPFSTVDDVAHWLDFLKGLAANFMPEHLSPIAKIGKLLLEKLTLTHVTKTLGQMDSESRFIKELNSRPPDPGVRYTILAGNVHDYRAPASARFPELIDKLGKSHPFSLMFGQKPHDIAVARDSILHVSAQGKQPPMLVACHHLNYFVSDAGQQALKAVAWK
jgi:pimeloyl-ACP methyl ester carboxylesterase